VLERTTFEAWRRAIAREYPREEHRQNAGVSRSTSMPKRVLLLGVLASVVDEAKQQLHLADIEFLGGAEVDDVRSAFAQADIDHVIMGGGLDLETRLAIVREVFRSSDRATVHMKDQMSGPEGFLPFVRAVLLGLGDYEPQESPHAVLRARRPGPSTDG
jgi:hypothetical protein